MFLFLLLSRRDFRLVSGYPDQALHPVWWADKNVTEEVSDQGVYSHMISAQNRHFLSEYKVFGGLVVWQSNHTLSSLWVQVPRVANVEDLS